MENNNTFAKILIGVVVFLYVIAPDLLPGPIDDIFAILIGTGLIKKQSTC